MLPPRLLFGAVFGLILTVATLAGSSSSVGCPRGRPERWSLWSLQRRRTRPNRPFNRQPCRRRRQRLHARAQSIDAGRRRRTSVGDSFVDPDSRRCRCRLPSAAPAAADRRVDTIGLGAPGTDPQLLLSHSRRRAEARPTRSCCSSMPETTSCHPIRAIPCGRT
jgi:hypothetical protein